MEFIVREAEPGDAEQLIAHVQRLTEEPGVNIALSPGEFALTITEEKKFVADCARSDNSLFLVAEAGNQVVGVLTCIGGKRKAARHTTELGMSIAQPWRNQGIGNRLMAHVIEWAKATGIVSRIELFVFARNEAAIHLYRKFGFAIEGRRQRAMVRDGEYLDDLVMALLL